MYLKRIAIQGFKSFVDRVDFDFSRGVTCIVGPNGCGKSNVIDAFKWVLGEQSAKLLRGRQMTDMIFNGSSARKAAGMARVDLFFDNSDRSLPLEYDEVCITRKLYRSGESEYLINNDGARLRDIREMFLDTGVGADTYSIIEQGRVDGLLTASPVERRSIFEEAAGIGKYKARKREAERKLERTQQNLLRVTDIIEEVEKRLRSVKLQAGKARNFQTYEARLKELRAGYSLAEFHRLTLAMERLRAEADGASDRSTELRSKIDHNEAEVATLAESINKLAEELSAAEQELMQTRSEIATHEERVDAAHRRIEEQSSSLQRVAARVEQFTNQRSEYETQLAQALTEAESLQESRRTNDERIRELGESEQRCERELTNIRANLEDEKDGLVDLVRRSTHLRNEIARLNSHSESLKTQQNRLGERDAIIRNELEDRLRRKNSLEARRRDLEVLIEEETSKLAEKEAERRRVDEKRQRLNESLGELKEERSAVRSRLQVLAELQRKMEGVGAGVRSLLEQKTARPDDPVLRGVCGMVGDLFEANVEHADIIAAAIGERDQHIVLENGAAFLSNGELYRNLPGRLTAICLDRLPPVINEPENIDAPGFVAIAADLVHCDERYRLLVRHLLGRTIVVESIEHALAMAARDMSDHRYVTRKGELIESDGSIALGPPASRAGLIARKSERRDLGEQLEDIEERARSLEEQLNRAAAEASHLAEVREDLRNAVNEANSGRAEAKAALEAVDEAVRRLAQEQPLIAGEVAMIEQQLAEAARKATETEQTAGQIDAQNQEKERIVGDFNRRIEELTLERDKVRHDLMECRVAAGKLVAKRASLSDAINHLRHGIQTAAESIASAEQERTDGRRKIEESEERILAARQRLDELGTSAERLEAGVLNLRRRREMVRVESEQLNAQTRTLRTELEEAEQRLHKVQMQQQESTVRRDELVARVRDELSIELAELYRDYDHNEQDWAEVEAEINELRQKIARLGNVNLDAINEQAELEERQQFLSSQWADLEDSRKQLESLIGKLDQECVERFETAFETIRDNFKELFRKLFGGGKADIVLENPEDILESGIEILARPPGKELQRISLMSGGEKTMTAIALLMSIFRSRPSPLALLDEVDAALDEANNVRYNEIIQEFLDQSQFVLVTHSKRTMAIADQLYGVTMQEPGVSSRVSVRFDDDKPGETAVA